jgi:hypothetical protein
MIFRMIHDSRARNTPEIIEESRPFRIVAIYDSAEASRDAARASNVVTRELGDDVLVDKSSWDLEALSSWPVCDAAASEAARADMIVVALGADSPSEGLKHWIQSWEKKRMVDGGLLALIPTETAEPARDLENYLYETAVTAQMDFLCRKAKRY